MPRIGVSVITRPSFRLRSMLYPGPLLELGFGLGLSLYIGLWIVLWLALYLGLMLGYTEVYG